MVMPWEMDWAGPTTPQPAPQSAPPQNNPWEMDWAAPQPQAEERPFGVTDTWPFRVGRAVVNSLEDAATLPGDVYTGKQSLEDPGITGRALNFAALAMPQAKGKIDTAPAVAKAPTSAELKKAGVDVYEFANQSPVALRGDIVSRWAKTRQQDLLRKGFRDTPNNSPDTFGTLRDLEAGGLAEGAKLTAGDYINLRETLQTASRELREGRPTKEAAAAKKVLTELDLLFDKAHPSAFMAGTPAEIGGLRRSLKEARGNFAASYRSDLITRKEHEADLLSATANSGKNYDNTVRRRLAGIALSKKDSAGFTPQEIATIERTAEKPARGANFLRDASNRLGGGGGLGATVVGGLAGGYMGGGDLTGTLIGMAIPQVAGGAMKAAENYLTKRAVNNLSNTIRLRSPLGEQASAAQARAPAPPLPMASEQALRLLTLYQLQNPDQL